MAVRQDACPEFDQNLTPMGGHKQPAQVVEGWNLVVVTRVIGFGRPRVERHTDPNWR